MSRKIIPIDTGISTYQTRKHNGFTHIHVNHPDESSKELNNTINQVIK